MKPESVADLREGFVEFANTGVWPQIQLPVILSTAVVAGLMVIKLPLSI